MNQGQCRLNMHEKPLYCFIFEIRALAGRSAEHSRSIALQVTVSPIDVVTLIPTQKKGQKI